MSHRDMRQIDLSPEFPEEVAKKYAIQIANKIGEEKGFQHVAESKYVTDPGFFEKIMPGVEDYVIGAEDTLVRYNTEYVSESDIEEAVSEKTEEARQEFTSWNSIKQKLE